MQRREMKMIDEDDDSGCEASFLPSFHKQL
jgi:hypothetical protein